MNIEFFHNVFGTWKGYVYKYVGSLDGITDIPVHVTERFVAATGHTQIVCSVVEAKPGAVFLYTQDLYPDNDEFKLYFDLLLPTPEHVELPPDPAPETPPTE